jgi:hypothetical protein
LKSEIKSEKNKTRKKREELSVSAIKSIKTENVEVVVSFEWIIDNCKHG